LGASDGASSHSLAYRFGVGCAATGRLSWNNGGELPALVSLPNDVAQQIRNGSMPPADYLILHPEARLSTAEKQQLTQGLQQSLASSLPK
jgi:Haem-binding domain